MNSPTPLPPAGLAALEPDVRERMPDNGEVYVRMELGALIEYLPTATELGTVDVPCVVVAGEENREPSAPCHHAYEVAEWPAGRLGTELGGIPGAHAPYLTHPVELADFLRPLLHDVAG